MAFPMMAKKRAAHDWRTLAGEPRRSATVRNGYFPQGENVSHPTKFPHKAHFYRQLTSLLNKHYRADECLAIMGDFNISPEDQDIGIGEASRKRWLREGKASFQPIEREWLAALKPGTNRQLSPLLPREQ